MNGELSKALFFVPISLAPYQSLCIERVFVTRRRYRVSITAGFAEGSGGYPRHPYQAPVGCRFQLQSRRGRLSLYRRGRLRGFLNEPHNM